MWEDSKPRLHLLQELETENQALKTELALARERISQLEALADEDVLVPVLNRRAFIHALIHMKAYDERYDAPLSLIYLDLNDFKDINDAHGHAAGDAVLRHVGEMLLNQFRRADLVGRLGGDEFAVLLTNSNLEFAETKARQLADLLAKTPIRYEGKDLSISAAMGVVQISREEDAEGALHRADEAMYASKDEKSGGT